MIKGKNLFITGGAGFIATSIIRRLAEDNRITVYDSLARNTLKDSGLWEHRNVKVIQGDVTDYSSVFSSLPADTDIVIHMAAVAGIDTVIKDPVRTMEVNMIGTYHVLKALFEKGLIEKLDRFIDFSTSEVFGINAFRVDEESPMHLQPVGEARWTYSTSKLAAEHLTHAYHKRYGLRTVTVRPFNIYGPGQTGEGAIHHFVVNALKNKDLTIHGEGDQIRSWCYIDDMVNGIMLCIETDEAVGHAFNIGNPRGTITILGLADKIVRLANSSSCIVHTPKNYADVDLRIPNIDKACEVLKYKPQYDLNEGIKMTLDWYRDKLGL
jgi:UDP-glucuronate decarboxylase